MTENQKKILVQLKHGGVTDFSFCSTSELRELGRRGYAKLIETYDNGIIAILPGVNLKLALQRYSIHD